jgi:hypothetical protein
MPFRTFGKIIAQGLKQNFNYVHHLQMWQSLNSKVSFMSHTMNPMECGAQPLVICFITPNRVSWKTKTPFAPKVMNLLPINYFVRPLSCIKAYIRTWFKLSIPDPTTTHFKERRIGIFNQFWTTYAWIDN